MYEDENPIEEINSIELNGTVYHGSSVDLTEDDATLISELREDYSDWDAVWVSDEESIAEEFSENSNWGDEDSLLYVVYEIEANCDNLAELPYDLTQELKEFYGLEDFREIIPTLTQNGYNGWLTTGSIGNRQYEDYALFNPSCLQIKRVKFLVGDEWTEYMSIQEGEEFLESLKIKVQEKELVRESIRRILREYDDDDIDWAYYELENEIKGEMLADFAEKVREHKEEYNCIYIDPVEQAKEHPDQLSLFDKDKYITTDPEKKKPYWDCEDQYDLRAFEFDFEGRQPWTLLNINTLKNVWWRFATTPPGIEIPKATIKTLNNIINTIIRNIIKVDINTEMTGHKMYGPDVDELEGYDLTEQDVKMWWSDYCEDDMLGQSRISDYAMDKLNNKIVELRATDDPHKRLQLADAVLEIVHPRSDIAGWFVKGGSSALSALSGYQRDQVAEVRKFIRKILK